MKTGIPQADDDLFSEKGSSMSRHDQDSDAMFRSLGIGDITLANRLAMAPMTRLFAREGVHDPRSVEYYVSRARAGIGLIISEGSPPPDPAAPYHPHVPGFDSEAALERWRVIASGVRHAGGHMLVQLWHAGLLRDAASSTHPHIMPVGPSGVFPAVSDDDPARLERRVVGRAMTEADIEATIETFASTAETCQRLGFSGVELHAAHGYLFDQFFWPETNLRTDRYGGTWAERTRFAADTVREIRRRTGKGFLISLRFSQFKPPLYNARLVDNPQELEGLLSPLAASGVDLFHVSTRRFWVSEFEGSDLTLAGWTKKISGLPTIAVGSVGLADAFDPRKGATAEAGKADLGRLNEMLARDDFDIIAIGRSLLANPRWASIVREEGAEGLRPYSKADVEELH